MGRIATTVDEQIKILETRGLIIDDEDKAKEILMDIGYYRLGFYLFPFEKNNIAKNRNHEFRPGFSLKDSVDLYYFDYEMRGLLLKYITRIEVNFRTKIIYNASNYYSNNPVWFADPKIVDKDYATNFEASVYADLLKHNIVLKKHHRKYINDRFAPAWKVIEFMSIGSVQMLYGNMRDLNIKEQISMCFGIRNPEILDNYVSVIRDVRNVCAHGKVLYDMHLVKAVRKGPAGLIDDSNKNSLSGAIMVILYMLDRISHKRKLELEDSINKIERKYGSVIKKINFSCMSKK